MMQTERPGNIGIYKLGRGGGTSEQNIDNIGQGGRKKTWKYQTLQITYGEGKRIDRIFSKLHQASVVAQW